MRRSAVALALGLAMLAVGTVTGCGKAAKKAAVFKPGAMEQYENQALGFSISRPKNLGVALGTDFALFEAKGFPKIKVRLIHTKENSTGSGSTTSMGKLEHKVYAPMRKLVCSCEDMGKHEDLVKKICRSLKNTKDAPKKPSVKIDKPKVQGKLKHGDAYAKALLGIEAQIRACWKAAVAGDPKFPGGSLGFHVVFKPDGQRKSWSLTRSFRHASHEPLTRCVEKLFYSVKPEPDNVEVTVDWHLRFELY
ncbi:MAG: hypothetical protein ABI333_15570 [bacterium]